MASALTSTPSRQRTVATRGWHRQRSRSGDVDSNGIVQLLALVDAFIEAGVDLNAYDSGGQTALYLACAFAPPAVALRLLSVQPRHATPNDAVAALEGEGDEGQEGAASNARPARRSAAHPNASERTAKSYYVKHGRPRSLPIVALFARGDIRPPHICCSAHAPPPTHGAPMMSFGLMAHAQPVFFAPPQAQPRFEGSRGLTSAPVKSCVGRSGPATAILTALLDAGACVFLTDSRGRFGLTAAAKAELRWRSTVERRQKRRLTFEVASERTRRFTEQRRKALLGIGVAQPEPVVSRPLAFSGESSDARLLQQWWESLVPSTHGVRASSNTGRTPLGLSRTNFI